MMQLVTKTYMLWKRPSFTSIVFSYWMSSFKLLLWNVCKYIVIGLEQPRTSRLRLRSRGNEKRFGRMAQRGLELLSTTLSHTGFGHTNLLLAVIRQAGMGPNLQPPQAVIRQAGMGPNLQPPQFGLNDSMVVQAGQVSMGSSLLSQRISHTHTHTHTVRLCWTCYFSQTPLWWSLCDSWMNGVSRRFMGNTYFSRCQYL